MAALFMLTVFHAMTAKTETTFDDEKRVCKNKSAFFMCVFRDGTIGLS